MLFVNATMHQRYAFRDVIGAIEASLGLNLDVGCMSQTLTKVKQQVYACQ